MHVKHISTWSPVFAYQNDLIDTRRRMHDIFGERERANCGRVSTRTCASSLVSAASQCREDPPPSGFSAIWSLLSGQACLPPSAALEVRGQLDPFLRKNDVWSFAALHHHEQPRFGNAEFCAAFMKFHICARIITVWWRPVPEIYIYKEKNRPLKRLGRLAPARQSSHLTVTWQQWLLKTRPLENHLGWFFPRSLELRTEAGYAQPYSIEASLGPKKFTAPLPLVCNLPKQWF